jgi:Predicted membrane protein (DUF2142)
MILRLIGRFSVLLLAPVLAVIALSAWAIASPVGASPDDDYHLTSIWCASVHDSYCEKGAKAGEYEVPAALLESVCFIHDPEKSAGCQNDISFDTSVKISTTRGNFFGEYPPIYYATMGLFAGNDIRASVVVMRLVNVLLLVALTTALFILIPAARRQALIWGWLISTVPLGLFILSSNNPSSWAIVGVGVGWLALLGWFETKGRQKVGLGIVFAIATVMAAGARGDAAVYAVLGIVVAAVIAFSATRRWFIDAILPAVFVVICAVSVVSARQSASAVIGLNPVTTGSGAPAPDPVALFASNLLNVPSIWAGVLGTWGLGWIDTVLPAVVGYGSIACFVGVGFLGFRSLNRRKALVLAGIGIVLTILPVYVLTAGGDRVGVEVQPRYLLPVIVMFAGVLALSVGARRLEFTRGQLLFVVITLSVVQFIALHTNMRRYITGTDEQGWNLNAGMEWWWNGAPSPMAVLVIGSIAYTALVVILAFAVSGPKSRLASVESVVSTGPTHSQSR